jgi:hypothetical protein
MTQPKVTITELDGALGVLPPSSGALHAILGVSSSGVADTPATYARITDLVADFGYGPAVEAAAYYIEKYGRPVVFVKAGVTTAGAAAAVVFVGTGTSVVTADVDPVAPLDDYEVYFLVVAGGTIGVTGITFRYSLDGGRTMSPLIALGTANTYTIPNSGVVVNFAAGTLVAADSWSFRTSAPKWNTTQIGSALDALKNSLINWEIAHVVGDLVGADFDAIDPKFTGMATAGKYRSWAGSFRMPSSGESEATYLGAFGTVFNSKATVHGMICAGACWSISSVSGRQYRRPASFAIVARQAAVDHEVNIADINLGSLPGIALYDDLGNVVHHDESVNPGLDDVRATVLRTWDGVQGVYVNRPRVLSAEGSDFELYPHRRVMNIALAALRQYFIRRLNRPIRVDAETGYILEADALEIEAGARAILRAALLAKPKASAVEFALSRHDNVLSTKTLTGDARIVPLGYPETISLEVGFKNPALLAQAA